MDGSRVFVALDTDKVKEVIRNTAQTGCAYKFGLRLIHDIGTRAVTHDLREMGAQELFCDAKLHDIPNTVADAVEMIAAQSIQWTNVMCLGGRKMMQAAVAARDRVYTHGGRYTKLLGVTILTSHDFDSLIEVGLIVNPQVAVDGPRAEEFKQNLISGVATRLATLARDCGLDGVIASPREARVIRVLCGHNFEIVTPGIRSIKDPVDDQKRTATADEAIRNGASRIVVGRPILNAANQTEAAERFVEEVRLAHQECQAQA